jgi:hypothetical protein
VLGGSESTAGIMNTAAARTPRQYPFQLMSSISKTPNALHRVPNIYQKIHVVLSPFGKIPKVTSARMTKN